MNTGGRVGFIGRSAHGVREAAFLLNFSREVCFIDTEAGTERLRSELAEAGLPALPSRLAGVALGPAGDVAVTLADGAVHRFDALYAALGVDPSAQLAARLGAGLDEIGNIITDAHGLTSVAGLYAAGDVVRALDQISVAVGQAAIAATPIHNSLLRAVR